MSFEDIKKHMATTGNVVSVRIPKSTMTPYHKSAVIEYDSKDYAENAVKYLHSSKLGTSVVSVFPQQFSIRENADTTRIKGYADRERNVFVGKLSPDVKDDDLRTHFSKCGTVEIAEVIRAGDGKSKRCGVVTFSTREEAQKAIATLHSSILMRQAIAVNPDKLISERGFIEPNKKFPTADSSRSVYVTNIHYDADEDNIRELMEMAGPVKSLKLFTEYNGRSKGRALVEYQSDWDARTAMETLDKLEFFNRKIYLRHCNTY
jgi:RNA recognition motif-containing protein